MLINGNFISDCYEKIINYGVYKSTKSYMKHLQNKNIDLSYPDEYINTIEEAIPKIVKLEIKEIECHDEKKSKAELDKMAIKNFGNFFSGYSMFLFRSLMKSFAVDSSYPSDASNLENGKIILKNYEKLSDLETLFYEILYFLVYRNNKEMVNLGVFPQAFRLIVADYFDSLKPGGNFVKSRLSAQIEGLNYSQYINCLYPSLTPVLLPHTIGLYIANEIFLAYKKDKEEFIKNLNAILDGLLSITEYLDLIDSSITCKNVDKVVENYQIVLK